MVLCSKNVVSCYLTSFKCLSSIVLDHGFWNPVLLLHFLDATWVRRARVGDVATRWQAAPGIRSRFLGQQHGAALWTLRAETGFGGQKARRTISGRAGGWAGGQSCQRGSGRDQAWCGKRRAGGDLQGHVTTLLHFGGAPSRAGRVARSDRQGINSLPAEGPSDVSIPERRQEGGLGSHHHDRLSPTRRVVMGSPRALAVLGPPEKSPAVGVTDLEARSWWERPQAGLCWQKGRWVAGFAERGEIGKVQPQSPTRPSPAVTCPDFPSSALTCPPALGLTPGSCRLGPLSRQWIDGQAAQWLQGRGCPARDPAAH